MIDLLVGAYKQTHSSEMSILYQCLQNQKDISSLNIQVKWESELNIKRGLEFYETQHTWITCRMKNKPLCPHEY